MAQLIVALDVPDAEQAERLVDQLYELDVIVKIGLEALYGYPERILSYCERATSASSSTRSCTTFRERSARRWRSSCGRTCISSTCTRWEGST